MNIKTQAFKILKELGAPFTVKKGEERLLTSVWKLTGETEQEYYSRIVTESRVII